MRRFLAPLAALAMLGLVVVGTADASTSYVARFGTTHGAARLTTGGPTTIYVNAKALARGTWSETLYRGTCSKLSTKILTLPVLTVGSSGAIARTNKLTSAQAKLLRTGVVRLVRSGAPVCAAFGSSTAIPGPTASSSASASATGSSPGSSASATSSPGGSASPSGSGSGGPSPSPSSSPGVGTLPLNLAGSGNDTSPTFVAPKNWGIQYSFDCSDLGRAGRFAIQVYTNGKLVETPVDKVAVDGQAAILETNKPGNTYLSIISECDWGLFVGAN